MFALSCSLLALYWLRVYYRNSLVWVNVGGVIKALHVIHRYQDMLITQHELQYSDGRTASIKRDLAKYYHPDTVLEDHYFYRPQSKGDILRTYIQRTYFDSQPLHEVYKGEQLRYYIDYESSPFTSAIMNYNSNSKATCLELYGLFDRYYHFPLPKSLFNKVTIARWMVVRLQKLNRRNRSSQCLSNAEYQTKSYVLNNPQECEAFFKRAITEYKATQQKPNTIHYIQKNEQHDQKGTELLRYEGFRRVAAQYDYGRKCAQSTRSTSRTRYCQVSYPSVTFEGTKFDIRISVLFVSTNPITVYIQKTMILMRCLYKFHEQPFHNQSHICASGYSRKQYVELEKNNQTEELKKVTAWENISEFVTFKQFGERLFQQGLVNSSTWGEDHLLPMVETRLYHLLENFVLYDGELDDPRFGSFSACEFSIEDGLRIWLLECTANPSRLLPNISHIIAANWKLLQEALPAFVAYNRQKYTLIRELIGHVMKGNNVSIQEALFEEHLDDQNIDPELYRLDFTRAQRPCR